MKILTYRHLKVWTHVKAIGTQLPMSCESFLSFFTYGLIGIICAAAIGQSLVHYGFRTAVEERMNKHVRDAAFNNLISQEIAWFDVQPVGTITTQLSDNATLIHSFSGEPIHTSVMNLSSVAVGLVVSFIFMW
jgi:ABC-type multidrug transport system fused ATPase/permease subunit